jgi:hypothetical protein
MDAEFVCRQLDKLQGERKQLDSHCQEVAELVLPYQANFLTQRTMGEKRTQKIFDSTAALALTRFTAACTSMLVPDGSTWSKLTTTNRKLNAIPRVRDYYDQVTEILFRERYRGGFSSQSQECFASLGAFGTTSMLVEPSKKGGLWYSSIPLSNFWIAENSEKKVDMVFRKFKMSARQASQAFVGAKDVIPDCIQECLKDQPHKEFEFVHAVMPNADCDMSRADYMGMPYASIYVCLAEKDKIVSRGGYHTFPMPVSRFMTVAGEPYGHSPNMTVLSDNKMLNEMEKTRIRAAHMELLPPLLLHDDLMGASIQYKPEGMIVGGLDSNGNQKVQQMRGTGTNHNPTIDLADQKRRAINDANYVTLFQILVDTHTMSATEVLERAREKGALLAPAFSRQHSEFLTPIIDREIDILARQGRLPEMPPELVEAGGEYEVVYDNPLSRAQKSEPLTALARTIEMITPIAQVDQSVLMNFDFDQISRDIPEYTGLPGRWIRSKDVVNGMRQQQQAAQQQADLLAAAPVLANIRKTEAEAQQIAQAGATGRV